MKQIMGWKDIVVTLGFNTEFDQAFDEEFKFIENLDQN